MPVRNDSAAGYCDLSSGCSYICLLLASYTFTVVPSDTTRLPLDWSSSYVQLILPGFTNVTCPLEVFVWL